MPADLSSFIGRQQELAELTEHLALARVLTLVGPGGIGKTRLALRLAAAVASQYPEGVKLVELAPLSNPELVPGAVASAAGVRDDSARSIQARLIDALHQRQLLLILDNCEHLLAACSDLIELLLRSCPRLQVLATSRQSLGVAGEVSWRVPILSLPDRDVVTPGEAHQQSDALQLFVQRATAARPGFALTDANLKAAIEICRRLDGIPLAIELAAARVGALGVQQIAERLDERFRLLVGGQRAGAPHQQTLRATLDWSYALLSQPERRLLERLTVFSGGWTLEGAEFVCAGDGISQNQVLDLLASLVDKSFVVADSVSDSFVRYRLLETIGHYAAERRDDRHGEAPVCEERHAQFFLSLAEAADAKANGPDQTFLFQQLESEHDNLRSALHWSLRREQSEVALRLTRALTAFWTRRGYLAEARGWLTAALALQGWHTCPRARARALSEAAYLAYYLEDEAARVRALAEESLALARELNDPQLVHEALSPLGLAATAGGDYAAACAVLSECLSLRRASGTEVDIAWALIDLGNALHAQGDLNTARGLHEESLARWTGLGDASGCAHALKGLGLIAYEEGELGVARTWLEGSLEKWRDLGERGYMGTPLVALGYVALAECDYAEARSYFEAGAAVARDLEQHLILASALDGFAALSAAQGDADRAARLVGSAMHLPRAAHRTGFTARVSEHTRERWLEPARQELGAARWNAAFEAGSKLSIDDALALAREHAR